MNDPDENKRPRFPGTSEAPESPPSSHILRTALPADDEHFVPLMIGNGTFGGCFDRFGFQNRRYTKEPDGSRLRHANTVLMHADHFVTFPNGLDNHVAVAQLVLDREPHVRSYRQHLDIDRGCLTTTIQSDEFSYTLNAVSVPGLRSVIYFDLEYLCGSGAPPPAIALRPVSRIDAGGGSVLDGECRTIPGDDTSGRARISVGGAAIDTLVSMRSIDGAARIVAGDEIRLSLESAQGHVRFVVAVFRSADESTARQEARFALDHDDYLAAAEVAWRRRKGAARIDVGDENVMKLWDRSHYYLLCNYAPEVRCPLPPMGVAGNTWGYHFPQDLSYVHPVLLRLGHLDIAKSIVQFYSSRIEAMLSMTRRVFRADGTMWAWAFPIRENPTDLFAESVPNDDQYEIHNAAYVSKMAYETAFHLGDPAWCREIAWPVIRETARFYASILEREDDGTWGIHLTPSRGQDEWGGANERNYLCALYSARYALVVATRTAESFDIEAPSAWSAIIDDGFAFAALRDSAEKLYRTCERETGPDFTYRQKHPVQLNPLTFVPHPTLDEYERNAYERRYDICPTGKDLSFAGWTLGAFWLADVRMGRPDEFHDDLEKALPAHYVDRDLIQFYGRSDAYTMQYYLTIHGLFMQAVQDALLTDCFEDVRIGSAVPPAWSHASFANFRTMQGHRVSAVVRGDSLVSDVGTRTPASGEER